MGFFNKKQEVDTDQPPRNPSNTVAFRVLAVGYVTYLCINMVKLYLAGGPDAPTLPVLIVGLVVLGGGALFLAFISYREWKIAKPAYDAYVAKIRAEAEARRAAEEAEAAALAAEDEYYEALEAAEAEDAEESAEE